MHAHVAHMMGFTNTSASLATLPILNCSFLLGRDIDLDLDYLRLLMPNLYYLRLNMIEGTFDICMTKNNEKICGIMILESKHHRTQDDLLNYFPNVDSVDRIVF